MIDIFTGIVERAFRFVFSGRSEERFDIGARIKGEIFWEMVDSKTGAKTRGRLTNTVTLDASILIARFLKGTATPIAHQCEPSFGVLALAVGTGYNTWDPLSPPPATIMQRSLWNELGRKAIQSAQFVTADGTPSGIPTNIVDFTTVFSESEAVGPWAEMGLIAGDANSNMSIVNPILPANGPWDPTVNVVGKDTLLNYLTFPVINKPATATIAWTWRITT